MATALYADIYAESQMEVISDSGANVENNRVVLRRCGLSVPKSELQNVIAEMLRVRFIVDPWAGVEGESNPKARLLGTYRVSRVRQAGPDEGGGIIQELRYGWMQPGTDAGTWAALDLEARITTVTDYLSSGKTAFKPYFVVVYPNVATQTVKAFVEGLVPRGTITNPTFDTQTQLSGTYKFTAAKNVEQGDGSSMVVAILVDSTDATGMEVGYANNCGSIVTNTIYGNLTDPVLVPAGTSGIEYSISSYNFSPELGMYSMSITKTEQKTLTAGVFTVAEDEDEKNEAQDFSGVRTGDVDHTGAAVPLWTPGNPTPGVEYTQQIRKNQNCTTDKSQKKRTVKAVVAKSVRKSLTLYDSTVATQNKAAASAASDPLPASGGVTQETSSEKNGLQQFDTGLTERTELPVTAASTSKRATVFATDETVVDKSQPLLTDLTPSAAGGVIIEKSGQKTPGALLDVQTATKTELPVSNATLANDATAYDTRESKVDRAQPLITSLAASASGGVIISKRGEKTPGGLLDVSTETKTELPVTAASVSATKTAFDSRATQVDRSQPVSTDLSVPAAANGVVTTKSAQTTPGALKDVTTETKTEIPVTDAVVDQSATIFEASELRIDRSQPLSTSLTPLPASGGVVQSKRGAKTEGLLLDVTTSTKTELPVSDATKSQTKTVFGQKDGVLDRAQPLSTSLVAPAAAGGVVVSKRGNKTDGGLLDVQTDTDTEIPVTDAVIRNQATIYATKESTTDKSQPLDTPLTASAGGGTIIERSGSKTPGGLLDVQEETTVELPVSNASVSGSKTLFSESAQVVDQNQPADTSLTVPDASGGVVTKKSGRKTPGNLLDVTTETDTEKEVDSATVTKRLTAFRSSVDTENRGKANPAADPSVPGQSVANSKTPGALYVQKISTDTPVEVADAGTSKTIDAFSVRTATSKANQTAKEAEPATQTPGTIERVSNRLNDLAAWDTDKTLDVATYRTWTTIIVDPTGVETTTEYRNATTAQKDAAIAASSIIVRKNGRFKLNAHLLYDGHITTHDSTGFTWGFLIQDKTFTRAHIDRREGKTYLVTYRYTYDERKNMGVRNGRELYAGAKSGSEFSDLAGDWYYYRKVTKVEYNEQEIYPGVTLTVPPTTWTQIE